MPDFRPVSQALLGASRGCETVSPRRPPSCPLSLGTADRVEPVPPSNPYRLSHRPNLPARIPTV